MKDYILPFMKAMLLSYVLSGIALFVLAFLLYQFDIKEAHLYFGILGIYVISCLGGGFFIGKKMKNRQFLGGMFVGLVYFSVHMGGVIAMEGLYSAQIVPTTALALLCMGSGMMGGLLS